MPTLLTSKSVSESETFIALAPIAGVAAPLLFFQSLLPYDPVAAQGGSADILWMRTPL
jgi:hypothetical protein